LAKKYSATTQDALSTRCVCVCDDDNDIEMALACLHAYIPTTSSESMDDVIRDHKMKFTVTASEDDADPTKATERALTLILERIRTGIFSL